MSKILPYDNITLETALKSEEIYQILSSSTEPTFFSLFGRNIFSKKSSKQFEGRIDENSFELRRIIYYRNSFLPKITGTVENLFHGSEIHIKLRMPIFVVIFVCIWLGMVSIALFVVLITNPKITALIPPFMMLLFGFGIFVIPFKIEARKAKNILKELLEAEIKNK